VLNSFLQFLEEDESEGLIIAATNHPELLDPALFRRFDDVIEYALPNEVVAQAILESRLSTFDTNGIDWQPIIAEAAGLSQADLARIADEAAKYALLGDRERVSAEDLSRAVGERKAAAHR